MSNALFDAGREGIADRTIDLTATTVKAALLRGYTYSSTHKFVSDLTGAGATLVATAALANKTYTAGVFDADDTVLATVTAGAACQCVVVYNDTGTATTSRVIAYIDTATGLPVTPNGQNITLTWDNTATTKIFKL